MTGAELAALVTALGGAIAGIMIAIAALINARNSAAKVDDLQDKVKEVETERDKLSSENVSLKEDMQINRSDIIILGEHYSGMSKDVSMLVLLVNKLYTDYKKDTGKNPDIDWAVLDRALTIQHKTTPLGPLQIRDDQ